MKQTKRFFAVLLAVIMLTSTFVFTSSAATLVWPVPGHTNLSQEFHDGAAIDISDGSIAGATIVAAMSGSVTNIFNCGEQHYGSMHNCSGFGTGVVILGDDNRYYQYAHMQANSIPSNVYQGVRVNAGQMIGRVGTTGNSTGNHLHFGISTGNWWNQSGINPQNETFTYSVPNNPEGNIDVCEGIEGALRVAGWAFDRDNLNQTIDIHIYYLDSSGNERFFGGFHADSVRTDVNEVFHIDGNHGFDKKIQTELVGNYVFNFYALNIGNGDNTFLGKRTATIKAHTHSYTSKITKPATCSATGVRTYTCSCGDSYTETIAKNASNHVNTKNVAATASTCTVNGYTAGVYCNDCKQYISGHQQQPLAAHTITIINQSDATQDAEGYTGDEYCTVCKQTIKQGTVIQKLDKPTDPTPDTPSNPQPENGCKWCGKTHTGFFGGLVGFFHRIFAAIFGARH